MMLGGVGFQVGLDEARRKQLDEQRRQAEAQRQVAAAAAAPDVVEQLKGLKQLREGGHLSDEEFRLAKQKVLGG